MNIFSSLEVFISRNLSHTEGYENITPVYETVPGWDEVTVGATSVEQLPANAIAYIKRLEEVSGVPIDIISTGPDRNETIILVNPFAE